MTSRPSFRRLATPRGAQAVEVIERDDVAFRREEHGERLADHLALVVAEQRLGRAVEREDAARLVEDDDAVGRRVEDGFELPHARLTLPADRLRCARSRWVASASGVLRISIRLAGSPSHSTVVEAHLDGDALRLPASTGQAARRPRRSAGGSGLPRKRRTIPPSGRDLADVVVVDEIEQEPVRKQDRSPRWTMTPTGSRSRMRSASASTRGAARSGVTTGGRAPLPFRFRRLLILEAGAERPGDLAEGASLGKG